MMDVMQTILHRRSIRRFDTRQIEEETLQQILQAGLYAPSAGGRQGVIYAVMQLLLGYPREGDKHPVPKPRKEGRVIRIGGIEE